MRSPLLLGTFAPPFGLAAPGLRNPDRLGRSPQAEHARITCLYGGGERFGAWSETSASILSSRTVSGALQVEDLGGDILVRVYPADEGAHLAIEKSLDDAAELAFGGVLEEGAGVPQALVLAHLRHPPLGRGETVFQGRDHDVGAGELGPRLGRTAPELFLVEADHLARDLRPHGERGRGRASVRLGALQVAHLVASRPPSWGWPRARKRRMTPRRTVARTEHPA